MAIYNDTGIIRCYTVECNYNMGRQADTAATTAAAVTTSTHPADSSTPSPLLPVKARTAARRLLKFGRGSCLTIRVCFGAHALNLTLTPAQYRNVVTAIIIIISSSSSSSIIIIIIICSSSCSSSSSCSINCFPYITVLPRVNPARHDTDNAINPSKPIENCV